jgi:farnesyl diphosphate synthase
MRHAVLGGGKRFRPFLVLETARMLGGSRRAALDVAAAIELVHCYSLVHDDLPAMDADRTRRGQPTVWVAFDEWTAILAGDALLTLAFEAVTEAAGELGGAATVAITRELARAAGPAGMVGGQMLDMTMERLDPVARANPEAIKAMQRLKTGALIRAACVCGALLSSTAPAELDRLGRFGDLLGLAFQISDDLLDATGDAAIVGKATAKDAAAGKGTLVAAFGVDGARARLAEVEAEAIATLAPYGSLADPLVGAVRMMSTRQA